MRFSDIQLLLEAEARIQHAEDLIFWEGSTGAHRAIRGLQTLAAKGHKDVTIKWDGSPAIIFGRNEEGQFVLTDKSGFYAKGYDGKATSPDMLRDVFLNRSGGKNRENPEYVKFANTMADLYSKFEQIVPKDLVGYFKGDLLYSQTPPVEEQNYVFKPNIVKYAVDVESDLGKRIGASDAGVVLHRKVNLTGEEEPIGDLDQFLPGPVLVVPPVSVEKPATTKVPTFKKIDDYIEANSAAVDALMNKEQLAYLKLTNLPDIFYAYLNSKVDTGLTRIGGDFVKWLDANHRLSDVKRKRIKEYIQENKEGFKAMWTIVSQIMKIKDAIIAQFDSHGGDVGQSINGQAGGEGYVLAHPLGAIKLVPRQSFSAANRAATR